MNGSGFSFRRLIVGIGFLAALWLGGLVLFVADINSYSEPTINADLPATDAIVVLTGGSERLSTGLELLAAGKGQKLLISGVYPSLSPERLLTNQAISKELRECCIALGKTADNTIGNALETSAWMHAEEFRSLRLVTANYHMRRSLLIFHELLPDIEIIPHPVIPESVKLVHWWERSGTARLLVTEYNKYLFAGLRAGLESLS